jgi:hypothetical protein
MVKVVSLERLIAIKEWRASLHLPERGARDCARPDAPPAPARAIAARRR